MATFRPSRFSADQLDLIASRNAQVKEAHGLGVAVEGLADLRRAFRSLDKGATRDLNKGLREAMKPVVATAKVLAPRGPTGRLVTSIRPFSAGSTIGVRSALPYANVIHWGGSTGPGHKPGVRWSGSILIRPSLFVSKAIERHEQNIVDAVGDVIDEHARRAGWK